MNHDRWKIESAIPDEKQPLRPALGMRSFRLISKDERNMKGLPLNTYFPVKQLHYPTLIRLAGFLISLGLVGIAQMKTFPDRGPALAFRGNPGMGVRKKIVV